jgi:hypothetical protein
MIGAPQSDRLLDAHLPLAGMRAENDAGKFLEQGQQVALLNRPVFQLIYRSHLSAR